MEAYLSGLGAAAEHERVSEWMWFVRLRAPYLHLGWLPIELELFERTLKLTSGFSVEPPGGGPEALRYLLRRNFEARPATFALDREGRVCLVARLGLDELDAAALDAAFGGIVEASETMLGSYLWLAFGRRPPG